MKTRDQFVLLAEAFRKEVFWRSCLLLLATLIGFFASGAVTGVIVHSSGLYKEGFLIWAVFFFLTILVTFLYQIKSQESLARKLELACPSCSRAIKPADLKRATATQNCPYCGNRIYS